MRCRRQSDVGNNSEVYYAGRVQGVGFRYTVRSLAARFDVTGFVRNLPDGRVHLVVEGDAGEIDAFLEADQGGNAVLYQGYSGDGPARRRADSRRSKFVTRSRRVIERELQVNWFCSGRVSTWLKPLWLVGVGLVVGVAVLMALGALLRWAAPKVAAIGLDDQPRRPCRSRCSTCCWRSASSA